ncbi:FtsK/SpoIIIE domain-containing protein [Dictyobacter arantiisoli]|uniref:FtsK domain-containing protein n=1 Tax=Dictyobacter arantiisoli TaxID=2014874 RepID=A0A5A5TFC0_9CHLR|nr:FtsK/SpoIIIE domain-containing protein [Dictyobacter arantiisoli]GCF09699.1 hypothetical protein KDI_32630 [Dictyobacter arantiisoli]
MMSLLHSGHSTRPLFEVAIEQIRAAYSQETARQEGIHYWPDPLPTPSHLLPDPLILFHPGEFDRPATESVHQHPYLAVIPMTRREVLERRNRENIKPSMQIPLGLIDNPEHQKQETLLVDLHGAKDEQAGGPLLIVGAQQSGKATALQTMIFWLVSRFFPEQLHCAIIDPFSELNHLQALSHMYNRQYEHCWTTGSSDEQINRFAKLINTEIQQRRDAFPAQRWNTQTLSQLWTQGHTIPQLLIIISNFQTFSDRHSATIVLKRLTQSVIEARAMGVYLIVTTTETNTRYLPAEIMNKCSTRIGLRLNEQQRHELFGRIPFVPEPVPGRGLIQTPDRKLHHIQIALPLAGKDENVREHHLKTELIDDFHA